MSRTIRIGIVWVNPYSENLGVGALAYSALAILSDVCKEDGIKAELTVIGSNGKFEDKIAFGSKSIRFNNVPGNDFLKLRSLAKLLVKPGTYKTRRLLSFDIVFDIAEGDSFTDIYGLKRFRKILNSKRFFNVFGIKQVLLPQTIGPFVSKANEAKAFGIMKKMAKVISRDRKSYEYTLKFLGSDKLAEAIDVAFYMPFERLQFSSAQKHIGINISGLLWNGGYTKNNQFSLKTDYRKLIENLITFFLAQPNVVIHLISHVISEAMPVEDDYTVAESFHAQYPQSVLAPKFRTPIEAKSYIGGLDFFTGARMHACIAAFSTGVPVVPMAYSRKFNGLFVETLQYEHLADCVNEDESRNLEIIINAFKQKDVLKQNIKQVQHEIILPRLDILKRILKGQLAVLKR